MKKKPLMLLLGFFLFCASIIYTLYQQRNVVHDYYAENVLLREKQVLAYLGLAQDLSEQNHLDKLNKILTEASNLGLFDWFIITYQGEPLFYHPKEMRSLSFPEREAVVIDHPSYSYQTVGLKDGSFISIGINKDPDSYFKKMLDKYKKVLLQDIVVPVLVSLGIFLFFFRDILSLINFVRNRNKLSQNEIGILSKKAKSREALSLARAVGGYEFLVDRLHEEKERLRNQVLLSIRKEIFSGKNPPYEFSCVLVRTDINNFTELFNKLNRDDLLQGVRDLFSILSVHVSRYGGYIHEFIGDEVIFYFKEHEHRNAFHVALACLRDFHHEASLKSTFTTKTSLSRGTLYFSEHVMGYNLSGAVLIETVRILSHANEKGMHTIHISQNLLPMLPFWAAAENLGEVQLKGFDGLVNLYRISDFRTIESVSKSGHSAMLNDEIYFRSIGDRQVIFDFWTAFQGEVTSEIRSHLIYFSCVLDTHHQVQPTDALIGSIIGLIDRFVNLKEFYLASVILRHLSQYLLSSDQLKQINEKYEEWSLVRDVHFVKSLTQFKGFHSQITYSSGSLVGNDFLRCEVLAYEFRKELSSKNMRLTFSFIKSEDAKLRRRALWVLFKTMTYWEKKDPVYFCARASSLVFESLKLPEAQFKIVQSLIRKSWNKLSLAKDSVKTAA